MDTTTPQAELIEPGDGAVAQPGMFTRGVFGLVVSGVCPMEGHLELRPERGPTGDYTLCGHCGAVLPAQLPAAPVVPACACGCASGCLPRPCPTDARLMHREHLWLLDLTATAVFGPVLWAATCAYCGATSMEYGRISEVRS